MFTSHRNTLQAVALKSVTKKLQSSLAVEGVSDRQDRPVTGRRRRGGTMIGFPSNPERAEKPVVRRTVTTRGLDARTRPSLEMCRRS